MANFTPHEQFMLELINRARLNPNAEAARQHVGLNEGPPSRTITSAPKEVLAGNDALAISTDEHNQWMVANNTLNHEEKKGTPQFYAKTFIERMTKAGFTPAGAQKENLGYVSKSGNLANDVSNLHSMLFVDSGTPGRGHRVNMMADTIREVGIGIDNSGSRTYVSQDFGLKLSGPQSVYVYITGVVYNDTTKNDNFFTVGEEQGGIGVSSTQASDTTGAGGGYELAYTAFGTKRVTFDLSTGDIVADVKFGQGSIKLDVVNGREIWTNAPTLTSLSATVRELHALSTTKVNLNGSDANEKIYGNAAANKLSGNGGRDTLSGEDGKDTITGGAGKDTMWGGGNSDRFVFKAASDSTVSSPDVIKDFGRSGNDKIDLRALGDLTFKAGAIDGADQVHVTKSGANVIVHINLDSNLADDMRITMVNTDISTINAGDFLL